MTESNTQIVDVLQLKQYCEEKSSLPEDAHEAFVAFYEFSGDLMPVKLSPANVCVAIPSKVKNIFFSFSFQQAKTVRKPSAL